VTRRTIVFVGNCQLGTLSNLYNRVVAPESDDEAVWFASYEDASPEQLRVIGEAAIVVRQVQDFAPRIGDFATDAAVHLVPHVTAAFLWPCTGQAHPQNQPHRYSDASGPYSAELSDSFLNRLILDGVDSDEAVARFMAADIATLRKADRLREILMQKQRSRDLMCGYRFADFIEANIQHARLFRSPNHPEIPLSILLATEVFGRLGVDDAILERIQADPPDHLFPPSETPIHPSVIAHFGLSWVNADTRYRFFDEGRYTCAEYALRYMRYEWNPLLVEGYELARNHQFDAAIETLQRAIALSPRSARGRSVLADQLAVKGRLAEAVAIAGEAAELEPETAHFRNRLAQLTARLRTAAPPTPAPAPPPHAAASGESLAAMAVRE
jgi:tetratricopeptide (TPR) repeat protein